MIVGAGFAHNFGLASSPKGVGPHGIAAVIVGILVCEEKAHKEVSDGSNS